MLLAIWVIPALMTALAVLPTGPTAATFGRTVLGQVLFHFFFAALCPAVYRLASRFPFHRSAWWRAALAHLAAAIAIVLGTSVFVGLMRIALSEKPPVLGAAIREELALAGGRPFVTLFYCLIVFSAMHLVRLSRDREREQARMRRLRRHTAVLEAQLAQARLQALEMQLNPHFLFNALNSIASLVEQQRGDDAYLAIARLGELLRRSLSEPARPSIELGQELAFVEQYLDLERLRFSDRLRVAFDVEAGCRGARVPAMLLQPLVENAVRHALGADPQTTSIRLSARRRGERLVLEVVDDGPGLPPGWTLNGGTGVGLRNVRGRLEALYGNEAVLVLEAAAPRGVSARLELPWSTAEPAAS